VYISRLYTAMHYGIRDGIYLFVYFFSRHNKPYGTQILFNSQLQDDYYWLSRISNELLCESCTA